jgi:hypothetical protein
MYGFRRAGASETSNCHSLEAAQELLGHDVGPAFTLRHYDPVCMVHLGLTRVRLGGEGADTSTTEGYFQQANLRYTRFRLSSEVERCLATQLDNHEEYQELDHRLEDC